MRMFAAKIVGGAVSVCLLVGMPAMLSGCGQDDAGSELVPASLTFGEVGLSLGQFNYPRAIDADGSDIWVVDKGARVQRLDGVTGKGEFVFKMPEQAAGKPTGVTVWRPAGSTAIADARVLVPDTHYHRVMIYSGEGTLLTQFGEYGTDPGQFIYPTDLAVLPTPDGKGIARLYVSEYGGHDRISFFEPDAKGSYAFAGEFGHNGTGSDPKHIEFSRPQSMGIDLARRWLVVTDACNHRVGVFTLDGTFVRWFGSITPEKDEAGALVQPKLTFPYGLALLGDGTALVAEFGGNRVQRVDYVTGESISVWGHAGRGDGELSTPWGVAVGGARGDSVFVLDSGNNRVMVFPKPSARTQSDEDRIAAAARRKSATKGGRS